MIALMLSSAGLSTDFDLLVSVGPSYSLGGWGDYMGTGITGRLGFSLKLNPSLRVGTGVEGTAFGSRYDGNSSLTMLSPHVGAGYYLRPWGDTFNPGVEVAGGFCRSALKSGSGADPVTWDPFWRAGIRWDFRIGAGFRGAVGFDYTSVLASEKSGDTFGLLFALSREVSL